MEIMDKHICTAFYELELEKVSYTHPYHKCGIKNTRKNSQTRHAFMFKFEEIPRKSLELKFKERSPTYSPNIFKRPNTSQNNNKKYNDREKKLLTHSFHPETKDLENIRIRGSSALMLKRKKNQASQINKMYTFNKPKMNTIDVKIKNIKNSQHILAKNKE
jgi:hypothetical protein